ncbi:MAG: winged helix-turn-helix transcriptional regulator [Candidatus Bathyarchaeia archaeon]|nr:winged helix-turn-helix transcriptional regulator [Candidatus Bathyarchaeia archaeon]
MFGLNALSKEGAIDILRRLSTGEAKFNELNKVVANTRTLTRRLKELQTEGLIQKVEARYKITNEGFDTVFKIAELKKKTKQRWIHDEDFTKIRYRWMRISLRRLVNLFVKEFGDELISFVLYGSATKKTFQPGRSDIDMLYILEDDATNIWRREENLFKRFQVTWEYKASDHLLKTHGFYGYPEVTTTSLHKSHAETFQLTYLDMLLHRAVLYDKEGFFQKLMKKLQETLKILGTIRVEHADGTYCWILKPDVTPGEPIEINLG